MKEFHIYKDIRQRTNGEIYLGVVGPVRTGKSTFIRRFMDEMVIPHMEDGPAKTRSKDELPQAASGKNIMTTEPKFIPTEAAKIFLEDKTEMKIRLIDCVGFLIPGAFGATEEEKERLVHTPWFDYDIPFSQAAELGTRKVIEEHSTVGIVVTTDGSVTGIERAAYEEAEKKTIEELKKHQKPFVVVLNTKTPYTLAVKQLTKKLQEMYKVTVVQACELLDDQTTKAREVRALAAAMEETGVRHGWILADSHQEEIKVSAGTIHCVPAPHFLMERELPSA